MTELTTTVSDITVNKGIYYYDTRAYFVGSIRGVFDTSVYPNTLGVSNYLGYLMST